MREIGEIYAGARRALVEAYWEIGRRIVQVEQKGEIRAVYGDKLIPQLSEELSKKIGSGCSVENLKRMRRFYLDYPKGSAPTLLTWSQYIELLPVENRAKRELLLRKAIRERLPHKRLRELVQVEIGKSLTSGTSEVRGGASPASVALLTPLRGKLHTHRIALKGGTLYLDLGFRIYRKLTPAEAAGRKADDIVELTEDGAIRKLSGAPAADLYTYEATLDHVWDGDTQWYFIFTGCGENQGGARPDTDPSKAAEIGTMSATIKKRNQGGALMKNDKLRLRGIDCPELKYAAGQAAKRFVEGLLSRATGVTVTTTKPDKFDRYLSDIFFRMKDGTELFLNNELLATGHARLYNDPKPEDWDD